MSDGWGSPALPTPPPSLSSFFASLLSCGLFLPCSSHNWRSVFSCLLGVLAVLGASSKPPQLRQDFCRLGNVCVSSAEPVAAEGPAAPAHTREQPGSGENSASRAECTVHHGFRGGRSCGNAAPEAEGCSRLWGTGFRAADSDASTSSPGLLVAFLSSTLQPVPSLPHQGAGRIRDSPSVAPQVFVLLACCFQRRMLVAFWEPGLPEQLRWRHFRAAQSGSDMARCSASLLSSFVGLKQGCFEAGTVSHRWGQQAAPQQK